MNKKEFDSCNIFGQGKPNKAYEPYFIGNSYLNSLGAEGPIHMSNVTFEPGCRNNWHVHLATQGGGQILLCTAGEGWYQEAGQEAIRLLPGTTIVIPAGVKHWHGATSDSWFAHISIAVPGAQTATEWLEPVADEYYLKLD